jgi:CRISPR-associated protein Csm1
VGVRALATLKGDVDNLGLIFQRGLDAPSFARMAALSRQLHGFFSVYLPWLCRAEFRETYTVFAGGDDFFLIGPWRQQLQLARRLREDFARYVAANPEVHFSAGLAMTKPGLPVRHLARAGEEALGAAKEHGRAAGSPPTKDAVTCFGETVGWADYGRLLDSAGEVARLMERYGLSARYLYGLLGLVEMREALSVRPENARWRSHFVYQTYRLLERARVAKDARRRALAELAEVIVDRGIERFGGAYRIALFNHLYLQRD